MITSSGQHRNYRAPICERGTPLSRAQTQNRALAGTAERLLEASGEEPKEGESPRSSSGTEGSRLSAKEHGDTGPSSSPGKKLRAPGWSIAARVFTAVVAGAFVIGAYFMPIWVTKLKAPQYPNGLELRAYGNRVAGDVFEVDTLNHYVGMKPFHFDDVPEARLWPVAILLAILAIVVSTLAGRSWLGRLSRLYLWFLPLGVLVDVQYRLYHYGHHLDPNAALRLKPFTPLVVGPTKVWNFTAWSMPGWALFAILAAAIALSFGPRLLDSVASRIPMRSRVRGRAVVETT